MLIPAFSALENIWLGRPYPRKGGLIQWKEMEKAAQKRGRTWDPFRPEEIHFPDDSGTEEMRRDPAGHDERCINDLRMSLSVSSIRKRIYYSLL